ncbi:DUF1127 domain-containing protein [Prosthecomicrobium sp. N25]|uniref:DUF1127 domain-containing protein n=1 Tax=Prosthecomicrobium sp. N25 TaxID=3129254 RepID=UPI00307884BE
MSATTMTSGPTRSTIATRLSGIAARLGKARRDRADMKRLMELDDRMLSDMGISRSEIEMAMKGRYY